LDINRNLVTFVGDIGAAVISTDRAEGSVIAFPSIPARGPLGGGRRHVRNRHGRPMRAIPAQPEESWRSRSITLPKAVAAGAKVVMPIGDQFWGDRYGIVTDPFGHAWSIATHQEDLTPDEIMERMKKTMMHQS
jgi:hypothetical protein